MEYNFLVVLIKNNFRNNKLYLYINNQSMQTDSQNKMARTYHNFSNINFSDSQPVKPATQANFRSTSQVGRMMTDQVQQPNQSGNIYHYNNKIAQTAKDYKLPVASDPQFEKNNTKYQQFFHQTKKFIKPYTQCTKYSDNLIKNRQLLRRGQFDLPTEPISVANLGLKNSNLLSQTGTKTHYTQFLLNKTMLRKNCETMDDIRKKKPSSDKKNGFDKTLKQYVSNYNNLFDKQYKDQKDQVKLKNSMNRILAAEMINYRLLSQAKPKSVRLQRRN